MNNAATAEIQTALDFPPNRRGPIQGWIWTWAPVAEKSVDVPKRPAMVSFSPSSINAESNQIHCGSGYIHIFVSECDSTYDA
jgi:hypothetical protein